MKITLHVLCVSCRGPVTLWVADRSLDDLQDSGPIRQGWTCPYCKHINEGHFTGELVLMERGHAALKPGSSALRANTPACIGPIARRERPLASERRHLVRETLALQQQTLKVLQAPFRRRRHDALRKQIRELRAEFSRFTERRRAG